MTYVSKKLTTSIFVAEFGGKIFFLNFGIHSRLHGLTAHNVTMLRLYGTVVIRFTACFKITETLYLCPHGVFTCLGRFAEKKKRLFPPDIVYLSL